MAYKNILTYNAKVAQVEQTYFSPTAVLPITGLPISSIYIFLSRIDPWGNDLNPDTPQQTQQYIKSVFKNMFVAKAITPNNITPVARRINGVTLNEFYRANYLTLNVLPANEIITPLRNRIVSIDENDPNSVQLQMVTD